MLRHLPALALAVVLIAGLNGCAQGPNVQTRATDQGLKLTLGPAFFDYKASNLRHAGVEEIERIAALLRQKPRATVTIEGHTDDIGSERYNIGLSMARADTVKTALIDQGIDRNRLIVAPMGETMPVAYNTTEFGRAQNRRVELIIH